MEVYMGGVIFEKILGTRKIEQNFFRTPNKKLYFEMCSLVCLNAKNEEKLKKYYFSFDQIKNKFAHFGGLKLKIYLNFLFGDCS